MTNLLTSVSCTIALSTVLQRLITVQVTLRNVGVVSLLRFELIEKSRLINDLNVSINRLYFFLN